MKELYYTVADEVFAEFPGYVRGIVIARGLTNGPSPDELTSLLRGAEESLRRELGTGNPADHPRIASWREAFRKLGMKPAEPTVRHVIIVAQVGARVVGLLVDAVSDILTVTDDNMQPTPDIANEAEKAYARGILAIEGRMICLLELESLFPHTESEAA